MFNYEIIYRKKQHYVTIPQKQNRKLYFNSDYLNKMISHQKSNEDMFITKYAEDGIVSCIILDFDDEDASHSNAFRDAKKVQRYTAKKGLNTVIVSSTNKGYHVYIQLPPRYFGDGKNDVGVDRNIWFNKFVEYIINNRKFKYATLDSTNTSAGLRGNIRIIGSVHPKTQERVHIVDGEFLDFIEPNDYEWDCMQRSYAFAETEPMVTEANRKEKIRELKDRFYDGQEVIENNDLRILMPQIFGGDVKSFKKGYIYMQCPFHNDSSPSCFVDKEKYFCRSCGAKGNVWSLIKMGYVKLPKTEFIRVKTKEIVKI